MSAREQPCGWWREELPREGPCACACDLRGGRIIVPAAAGQKSVTARHRVTPPFHPPCYDRQSPLSPRWLRRAAQVPRLVRGETENLAVSSELPRLAGILWGQRGAQA